MALTAKMTGLKGQLKLSGQANDSKKKWKSNKGESNKEKFKKKNKKPFTNKERQKKDEAWKKTPPKDDEPTSKTVDGKLFQWCIHHMAWVLHTSSDCRLGQHCINEQAGTSQANSATTAAVAAAVASSSQMNYLADVAAVSQDE